MAINKKLIHFNKKEVFEEKLANNEILNTSIVFIQDSNEIWTHNTYYATLLTISEIENIVSSSETIHAIIEQVASETIPVSLELDGDGLKFLSNDGTYKSIEVPENITEETVSNWGFAKQEDTDLPQINQTELVYTIQPNVFNVWGEVATLDITLGEEQEGIVNEFLFQFTSGETPTTLILPDTIKWVNDAPEIEANMTYQCSIINNIGVICGAL